MTSISNPWKTDVTRIVSACSDTSICELIVYLTVSFLLLFCFVLFFPLSLIAVLCFRAWQINYLFKQRSPKDQVVKCYFRDNETTKNQWKCWKKKIVNHYLTNLLETFLFSYFSLASTQCISTCFFLSLSF